MGEWGISMYFMKFEKIINLDYTNVTDKSENQIS